MMRPVRETQIATARTGGRLPGYSLLDHAVVARCAARRIGENRLLRLGHPGVTCSAQRKEVRVLRVRKTFLLLPLAERRGDERATAEHRDTQRDQPLRAHVS